MPIRPRRSMLYMPGSNARAIAKARTLPVDGVILDLEDSVAPDAKVAAREQVAAAVKEAGFGGRELFVRVNGLDTPWFADDFAALAPLAPDGVLVPKISSPAQLEMVGKRLLDMHVHHRTRVWAMMETPLALLHVREIATAALDSETRFAGFVLGTNDLAKETGTRLVPGRWPMLPWLMTVVAAARAYGLVVLDGVYNDIGDPAGFAAECAQARDMGLDGKTVIHPSQIEPCNAAFSPTAEEVAQARRIIAAFDQPENKDKGVVSLDGKMVERLHADMARRTVAIADAIARAQAA